MAEIGVERDLDLGEHETGYEWEAGETPPDDRAPGKWIVRKDQGWWMIFFRSLTGAEYNIYGCPLTELGERIAKITAIKMVDIAWGR